MTTPDHRPYLTATDLRTPEAHPLPRLPRRREDAMSDRIHLAYCDQCGDEICEGDEHRVERAKPSRVFGAVFRLLTEAGFALVPIRTRYTCERCIAGEVRQP